MSLTESTRITDRGKNAADDFLFISDQWMKYPEKKGRRMPLSKNYPAPCEIHNTH